MDRDDLKDDGSRSPGDRSAAYRGSELSGQELRVDVPGQREYSPASELESKLDITGKEADANIKYRSDKGPFKTIDELKKVPDLDFRKIEAKKDWVKFQA